MWRLQQKVHCSWLLALAAAGFVIGVAAALVVSVEIWVGLAALMCCAGAIPYGRVWVLVVVVCSGALFGCSFGTAHQVTRGSYKSYTGQFVVLEGRVKEDPSLTSSKKIALQLDTVRISGESFPGTVLVTVRVAKGVLRGDDVRVRAVLKDGFASFPATMSAEALEQVTRTEWSDPGRVARDWFANMVRTLIPEPQASLGIGFLTGQKSALPPDLADALKIAGLTHIVVASGYNLTILVRLARKLFLKVSKYLSAVTAGCMIVVFVAMTGMSPSMTRAGLVSSLSLLTWYYGHSFHPLVLLPLAAAVTVAFQPSYVWGDMGWQLSFSAFAGVMIVAPLLQRYFFGNKEPKVFRQILGETIAAHIVTLPIIALSFGAVSNVAIIANLLVVPLVPLAMLMTFICGIWAMVGGAFGWLIAEPTTFLLSYMVNVATFVSEIPWAQSSLVVSGIGWVGYAVAIAFACFWMWRKTKYNFRGEEALM